MKRFFTSFITFLMIFGFLSSETVYGATQISGRVCDSNKRWVVVSNAKVIVTLGGSKLGEAVTDSEGECTVTFASDVTGTIKVTATAEGYKTGSENVTITQWGAPDFDIALESESKIPTEINLCGYIMDKDRAEAQHDDPGIEDASVTVSCNGVTVGTTTTEWDGWYDILIKNPVDMPYTITAEAKDYLTTTEEFNLNLSNDRNERSVRLEKDPARKMESVVSGRVKRYDNYQVSVSGAEISLFEGETLLGKSTTDNSGNFTITVKDRELNGKFLLKVVKDGFNPAEKEFTFTDGKALQQDFMLRTETCEIHGVVTDITDNKVIDHALVVLCVDGKEETRTYTTSWSGYSFELSAVIDCEYSIAVSAEDYISTEVKIGNPEMGQTVEANAQLKPALVVEGVVRAYGQYVAGVTVAFKKGETRLDAVTTNEYGDYKMVFDDPTDLPADGEYTITATKEGYLESNVNVAVAEGRCPFTDIDIRLPRTIISGNVRDEKYNNLAGISVKLQQEETEIASAQTDESGFYTITLTEVNANPYTLVATDPKLGLTTTKENIALEFGEDYEFDIVLSEGTGVAGVTAAANRIEVLPGAIRITGAEGENVTVTSVTGISVAEFTATDCHTIALARGIYIVDLGGKSTKIIITQ